MTSTTSAQFGTVAQVEIVPPFGPGVIINPDLTGTDQQLRVDWQVSKGVGTGGKCTIRIYNLGEASRARVGGIVKRVVDFGGEFAFLDGRLVTGADLGGTSEVSTANGFGSLRLSARYSGQLTTANLFEGTATSVVSVHRRHTWVTTITGGDGVLQDSSAIADKFWASTVPALEVIDYLVRRVMVASIATPIPPELAAYSFLGGYDATNFYASDILDQLTALTRTEWWWDDGAIYFSSAGQPLTTAPITVTPSGAPGTYLMLSKPARTDTNEVEIRMLNLPQLRPKSPVTVVSSSMGGTYFAKSIMHRGSNRGRAVSTTTARLAQIGVVPFLS